MNQTELVKEIARRCPGTSQKQTKDVLSALAGTIIDELEEEDGSVDVPGLGRFSAKEVKGRTMKNHLTGGDDLITIKPRVVPKFKPCKAFKTSVRRWAE